MKLLAMLAAAALSLQSPVFHAKSELVVLHVLVKDAAGAYVGGLPADAFRVYEDTQEQAVRFFAPEDAPVTVGLLLDSSGSMRSVRDRVIAAATAFVDAGNPGDEVFALAFDDDVRPLLPESSPFTNDAAVLGRALIEGFRPAGRTALNDAVERGLAYVRQGTRERQALVVLSDGGDNASHAGFAAALRMAQASNTAIYAVALVDPIDSESDPGRLAKLAATSGGAFFEPRDVAGVELALRQIASDIRHSYTIGYEPPARGGAPGFHHLRVDVRSPDGRSLVTRTREGYHGS